MGELKKHDNRDISGVEVLTIYDIQGNVVYFILSFTNQQSVSREIDSLLSKLATDIVH